MSNIFDINSIINDPTSILGRHFTCLNRANLSNGRVKEELVTGQFAAVNATQKLWMILVPEPSVNTRTITKLRLYEDFVRMEEQGFDLFCDDKVIPDVGNYLYLDMISLRMFLVDSVDKAFIW